MSDAKLDSSAWAPLRIRVFRSLLDRGAGQQRGHLDADRGSPVAGGPAAHAATLVALVQAVYTLPAVLFALVGGVLADIFNRARLLTAVLAGMTVTAAALTALTAAHRMPPALLLTFTFVLGTRTLQPTMRPDRRACPRTGRRMPPRQPP